LLAGGSPIEKSLLHNPADAMYDAGAEFRFALKRARQFVHKRTALPEV
jgi:hypothetical protein